MTQTQEANQTPEVTVVSAGNGAVTATVPADFTKPEAEDKSLLAGKFKTPADLEKAYKELESKLGQAKPQQPAEETKPETEAKEEATTEDKPEGEEKPKDEAEALDDVYAAYGENIGKMLKEAGIDPTAMQKEFAETGTISEESRKDVDKIFGKEMVDAYLRGVAANRETQAASTEAQITQIMSVAGGEEGFSKLQGWMAANLSEAEVKAYNDTLASGDVAKITAAVAQFNARYQADIGSEGKLLGGKATSTSGDQFAGDAEYLQAVADPRYKTDESYRNAVIAKLARSPDVFMVR